jgi:hypothetical protein
MPPWRTILVLTSSGEIEKSYMLDPQERHLTRFKRHQKRNMRALMAQKPVARREQPIEQPFPTLAPLPPDQQERGSQIDHAILDEQEGFGSIAQLLSISSSFMAWNN